MINILKSLFISTYPLLGLSSFIYAINLLLGKDILMQNIGLALTGLSVTLFFLFLFIFRKPRTSKLLLPYTMPILIGTAIVYSALYYETTNNWVYILSTLILIGQITYLFWYSNFENRVEIKELSIGKILPKLKFEDSLGKTISNTDFSEKYAIYIFYRGNWCPLCMAQIKEIVNEYKTLSELGARVNLISPQPHKYTNNLAEKYKVDYRFLVDSKNAAAQILGIDSENGLPAGFQVLGYDSNTVLPTVIITNNKREIIYSDLTENYRIRPEPKDFIRIIEKQ